MQSSGSRQLVSPSQVADLAGVAPSTVSNWRARSSTFPSPSSGSNARPLFDMDEVLAWLKSSGKVIALPQKSATALRLGALLQRLAPPADHLALMLPLMCLSHAVRSGYSTLQVGDLTESTVVQKLRKTALKLPRADTVVREAVEDSLRFFVGHETVLLTLWKLILEQDLRSLEDELLRAARKAARQSQYAGDPVDLAELLAGLFGPMTGRFADLACGYGEVLSVLADANSGAELHGTDIDSKAVAISSCRMFLRDVQAEVAVKDVVTREGSHYDALVLSPPLGLRLSEDRSLESGVFPFGLPKDRSMDLGWPQIALERLHADGTAAVVVPAISLYGAGKTREIRQKLLSLGCIEGVIGLPRGLHFGTGVASAVLILRKPGQSRRKGEVFMANLDSDQRNGLVGIDRVLGDFKLWLEGYLIPTSGSLSVPVVSLLAPEASLNPAYWLATANPVDVKKILTEYDSAVEASREKLDALIEVRSKPRSLRRVEPHGLVHVRELGVRIIRGVPVPGKMDLSAPLGNVPVLTSEGVDGVAWATHYGDSDELSSQVRTIAGDVAIAIYDGDMRTAVCEEAGLLVDRSVTLLRPDPDSVDSYFLAAALLSEANRSTVVGNVTMRIDAERLRVPRLAFEEQRGIGTEYKQVLHLRESLIKASAAISDLQEAMARAVASGTTAFH